MADAIHLEAVEHVLSAIYGSGDRLLSSFMFGRPGTALRDRRLGTELFVRPKEYTRALLFIRRRGAQYLRAMSIDELWSLVTEFVTENYWYIHDGTFGRRADCSLADQVIASDKLQFANALAQSALFEPKQILTLFPLVSVRVEDAFKCDKFFVLPAHELSADLIGPRVRSGQIEPTQFPPVVDWTGLKHRPASWLGVRSPLLHVSIKAASAILGAVALTPQPSYRHLFSDRKMFGGRCTLDDGYSVSFGSGPHTPPMMHDIILTAADHGWLSVVANLVVATDTQARKRLRALEYFYRAWFLDPRERFPLLCMALDSLVGATNSHTKSAIAFVQNTIEVAVDEHRLRLLMRLRGSVVHGAAPDVYDSDHYEQYYAEYETDPIRDLELIVAKCLRNFIFGGTLTYHANPNARIIAEQQAKGRMPRKLDDGCIVPSDI